MKRFFICVAMLLAAVSCRAQNTSVTAVVTDPIGNAYAFGTGYAALVCPGNQQPTYNGYTVPRTFTITGLDGNGKFVQVVYDLSVIQPTGCGYQWHITYKDGVTTFITGSITNVTGSSVNESAAISAYAVPLPSQTTGAINCTTTGGVAYQNGTNNTLTCNSGLTYAPGAGNQLTLNGPNVALSYAASDQIGSGAVYTLSAAGNASAGLTIYTGTVPGGSALIAGMAVTVAGFTNSANNGRFVVQGSTLTTITLYNGSGVAESHAATATVDLPFGIAGGNAGDAQFFQFGRPGTLSTFALRGTTYQLSDYRATWPNAITYAAGVDGDNKDGLYLQIVNNGATGDHYFETGGVDDGTGANPNACRYGNQGGVEDIKCSKGGGTFYSQPQIICSGQIALSTGSITQGQRATNTLACTGISTSTDTISCTFNSDTNAVTGYAPSTSGGITLKTWISTNTINVDQVNDTGAPLTPGAATINCKAIR